MKRILLFALLVLLALSATACQVVTGDNYTLPSGRTLNDDLVVLGGNARLEQGSRVTGSLSVVGGTTTADGQIDGDVWVTGGDLAFGPNAVVRGGMQTTGGSVTTAPGARVPEKGGVQLRAPIRTAGRVLVTVALLPLLIILVVVILVLARSTQPGSPQATATGATPTVPFSTAGGPLPAPGGRTNAVSGSLVFGILLIALGILFLFQEVFNIDVWSYAWPLLLLAVGVFFFVAMALGGRDSGSLALPGSILTMLGLIFLFQNAFDQFQTWAYAWALVFPTSVGIGHWIEGRWSSRTDLVEKGISETRAGLIIFIILAAFFELVLNLNGFFRGDIARFAFPILLILLGVLLLFGRLIRWPGMTQTPRSGGGPPAAPPSDQQRPA